MRSLCDDLRRLDDPRDGTPLLTSARPRDELFHGPWVHAGTDLVRRVAGEPEVLPHWDGFADIFIGFAPGYRVSWSNTMGGVDGDLVTENDNRWSGGYVSVDPSHVPGVLFSNHRLVEPHDASLLDVGPTLLTRYGLDPTQTPMEGSVLPFEGLAP